MQCPGKKVNLTSLYPKVFFFRKAVSFSSIKGFTSSNLGEPQPEGTSQGSCCRAFQEVPCPPKGGLNLSHFPYRLYPGAFLSFPCFGGALGWAVEVASILL